MIFQLIRFTLPSMSPLMRCALTLGAFPPPNHRLRWAPFHPSPKEVYFLRHFLLHSRTSTTLSLFMHLPVRKYDTLCCPDFPLATRRRPATSQFAFTSAKIHHLYQFKKLRMKQIRLLLGKHTLDRKY